MIRHQNIFFNWLGAGFYNLALQKVNNNSFSDEGPKNLLIPQTLKPHMHANMHTAIKLLSLFPTICIEGAVYMQEHEAYYSYLMPVCCFSPL